VFIPATWDASKLDSAEARTLANRIKLRLAEFMNGDWTESELRQQLSELLPALTAVPGATSAPNTTLVVLSDPPDAVEFLKLKTVNTSCSGETLELPQLVAA